MPSMFQSERLCYRAYEPCSDIDALHAIRTNADSFRLSFWDNPVPQSCENTRAFAADMQSNYLLFVMIYLSLPGVEEKDEQKPIGYIGLARPEEFGAMHRNTRISINLLSDYQGKGYGAEAIQWSLTWAFRVYGLHRVMIRVYEYNYRALNLYKKLGFQEEGRWREHVWYDGRFWDHLQLGMLDREWRKRQIVQ